MEPPTLNDSLNRPLDPAANDVAVHKSLVCRHLRWDPNDSANHFYRPATTGGLRRPWDSQQLGLILKLTATASPPPPPLLVITMIDPAFKQEHELTRCKYPSKICRNTRTRKRNGQLHRFCEEHRARANFNQKRWSATRQKRWDTLAHELGRGFDPVSTEAGMGAEATASFAMLSLDNCEFLDLDEFDPITTEASDNSWQDAATDELREFLGDLLLSIATDDVAPAQVSSTLAPVRW